MSARAPSAAPNQRHSAAKCSTIVRRPSRSPFLSSPDRTGQARWPAARQPTHRSTMRLSCMPAVTDDPLRSVVELDPSTEDGGQTDGRPTRATTFHHRRRRCLPPMTAAVEWHTATPCGSGAGRRNGTQLPATWQHRPADAASDVPRRLIHPRLTRCCCRPATLLPLWRSTQHVARCASSGSAWRNKGPSPSSKRSLRVHSRDRHRSPPEPRSIVLSAEVTVVAGWGRDTPSLRAGVGGPPADSSGADIPCINSRRPCGRLGGQGGGVGWVSGSAGRMTQPALPDGGGSQQRGAAARTPR